MYDSRRKIHRPEAFHVFTSVLLLDTICADMGSRLVAAVLFLCTLPTFAGENFKIVAIRSTGSHEFSQDEIARASGLKLNQFIGPAEFRNAADRLAATGAFAQVSYKYGPMGTGMFVEFQVEDAPEFLPVRFENFVWMSDGDTTAELTRRVPLFHGRVPPGGGLLDDTVAALQALLTERGVAGRAGMRMHTPSPNASIDAVSFYVEGPTLLVKSVDVRGVSSVAASDVNSAVKSIVGMSFDRGVIEESIGYRLTPILQAQGLLHAEIGPPAVTITGDPKNPDVILQVQVAEGPQYKFGRLAWSGNTVVPESELNKTLAKCSPGAVASLPLLMEGAKQANGIYASKGYLEAKVRLNPTFHDVEKTVDYDLQVIEGRQFHMGRVRVVGLDAPQCEVLEAGFPLKQGDPYDEKRVLQFVREHLASQRGRPVKTTTSQNRDATVDVRIEF